MSSGRYFLLVLLSIAVESPTVEATCDGVDLCQSAFPYNDVSLITVDFRTPELVNEFCQHFHELDTCMTPEITTCDLPGLQEQWSSIANGERYLCSDEGRSLYLDNIECLDSQRSLDAIEQCLNTFNSSSHFWVQQFRDGSFSSADEAFAHFCGVMDDYFRCVCVEILPICGQDAATFFHAWLYKQNEGHWRTNQCPALYGSVTSCSSDVTERPISMTSPAAGGEIPTAMWLLVLGLLTTWLQRSTRLFSGFTDI